MSVAAIDDGKRRLRELMQNQLWRMNNLYAIEPKQGGVVKFRMNAVQKLFWKAMHWLNVVLKSRQHGMSTLIAMHMLDTCLFNPNVTCGIIDKTRDDATKKLAKIKLAYDKLDSREVHAAEPGGVETWKLGGAIKEAVRIVKSNESEIEFSNGSKVWVGIDLRGGTVQYLHVSELGPIAYKDQERAQKIRAGAFNTIHAGCKIVIESTHEGGKTGLNYEMVRLAQKSPRDAMSPMHWKFFFFAWWQDPDNAQPVDAGYGLAVTPELEEYFRGKEEELGITLSREQRYWYAMKRMTQQEDMLKEHPSDAEEALNAAIKGAIYGKELAALRADGRILNFAADETLPFYTFWDVGDTDYTCIALMQKVGMDWNVVDYFSWHGKGAKFYATKVAEWERKYEMLIACHFMPHDVKQQKRGGSWVNDFRNLRIGKIRVVPVTPDVWIGIKHLRTQFPRLRLHDERCSKEFEVGEIKIPSLIGCLEGYHTELDERNGVFKDTPKHDAFSHGADCLRVFAEAHKRGLIDGEGGSPHAEARRRSMVDHGSFGESGFRGVSRGYGGNRRVRY